MRSIIILFILFCVSPAFHVRADGIGSVWIVNVTSTTIRVAWNYDHNKYNVKGNPKFKVCYKLTGSWEGACDDKVNYTNDEYIDLSYNISPNTSYRVKVVGQSVKKKNGWTEDRQIENTIATTAPETNTSQTEGTVWVSDIGTNFLQVNWNLKDPYYYHYGYWVRWKRDWSVGINSWVQPYSPLFSPGTSPPTYKIENLVPGKRYIIQLWGYEPNMNPLFIAETFAKTTGHWLQACIVPQNIIYDFEDNVYWNYAIAIDSFYGCSMPYSMPNPNCESLFNHLVQSYPQLDSARNEFLSDSVVDIGKTLNLIKFLVVEKPEIYQAWQSDSVLVSHGLDLQTYTNTFYPGVWNMVQEDCNATDEAIPTLSQWGLIIFSLLLLSVCMVFVQRRQMSLAIAGVGNVNATPSSFNRTLYLKVLGVVLLVASIGLAVSSWYFGSLTKTDLFGTLVSAGIVAYMIQVWMLIRRE